MYNEDNSQFLKLAHHLADLARDEIIPIFRKEEIKTEKKNSFNNIFELVTEADKNVELLIRKTITEHFPDHGIIGEETGLYKENSDYIWIIDPIDGTKAFIAGLPIFGTMISLKFKNKLVLGLIDQAITKERIWSFNNTARLNGKIIKTKKCVSLAEAVIACTDPIMLKKNYLNIHNKIFSKSLFTRYGTDCWGYAMCAAGHIDAVIESDLKIWDLSAAESIINSSGGIITTWDNRPLGNDDTACAAGDKMLHSILIDKLSQINK